MILDYNSIYIFQPNSRAIYRLIFKKLECTIDHTFNLRDLVLKELVKIIVICDIKNLRLKYKYDILHSKH